MSVKNNKTILYPGSFDPFTLGHLDIIKRASCFFETIHVLVASSSKKSYLFSLEKRFEMVKNSLKNLPYVQVDFANILTSDYARKNNIFYILRGIRSIDGFLYEKNMMMHNKRLFSELETVFLFSKPEYEFLSSTFIKEIALGGGNLDGLISDDIKKYVDEKIKNK